MNKVASSTIAKLNQRTRELERFNRRFAAGWENHLLAVAVITWIRAIARRAVSISLLLEQSHVESALVLLRGLREKCIDLALLCSWVPPREAAIRAHIFQRLAYKKLAARRPEFAKNVTFSNLQADLQQFENECPDVYHEIAKLDPVRHHWSGMGVEDYLAKAGWVEPNTMKIQLLLTFEVHGNLDLPQADVERLDQAYVVSSTRTASPELLAETAKYTMECIEEAIKKLDLLPSG